MNERKELWSLPNNFVGNDPRWISAEVPITAENTEGFEYRVGQCIWRNFYAVQKNRFLLNFRLNLNQSKGTTIKDFLL